MADVSLTLAYYFSIFFSLLLCIVFVRNDIPNIMFACKHIDIVYACIVLSCIVRRFTLCSSLFGFVFPFQFFNIYIIGHVIIPEPIFSSREGINSPCRRFDLLIFAVLSMTAVVAAPMCRWRFNQRWSNIRLATRPESVTRDRRATYEG